jgi:hypothetical protein
VCEQLKHWPRQAALIAATDALGVSCQARTVGVIAGAHRVGY